MFKTKSLLLIVACIVVTIGFTVIALAPKKAEEAQEPLRFATWASSPLENMVIDRVIDSFTQKTGIEVERETYTHNYSEVLTNQFRQNQAPDVFFVEQSAYDYWQANDWLMNLDHLITDRDDYLPTVKQLFTTDEQFYSLPKDFATLVLFVNEDLLAAAGYTTTDIPTTMSEFLTFLGELQAKLPAEVTAMTIDAKFENFMSLFQKLDPEAFANKTYSQSPQINAFLANLGELINQGAFKLVNETFNESSTSQFRNQTSVFTLEGNWLYADLEYYETPFDYEILRLPKIHGEEHTSAFFTGYSVSSQTQAPEAATMFVEYMTTTMEPYIIGKLKSFPVKHSLVTKAVPASRSYVEDIVNNLGEESIWNQSFIDMMYSHFFSIGITELLANPEQTGAIFARIEAQAQDAAQFMYQLAEQE